MGSRWDQRRSRLAPIDDAARLDEAREALRFALDVITRLKPGETLGTNRFEVLRKRLDIVRGRESASNRALNAAQSALMAVLGYISARSEQTAIDAQTRDDLRTRLQNAIDGLPTQLGGEPLLPT